MNSFFDIVTEAEAQVTELTMVMAATMPEDVGLDHRAARRLWINTDGIVARMSDDRVLQYYGGFEYVNKDYRTEVGKWVFYSAEDDRVQECIDRHNKVVHVEQDEP